MSQAAEDTLGGLITHSVALTKYDHVIPLRQSRIYEAAHPVPDESCVQATQEIIRLLEEADETALVLLLISGGGSSLLCAPAAQTSLAEKQEITGLLLNSGATIAELNAVRKHLSAVKGGQLASIAAPAEIHSLIVSDVIGDPLDVIASGPTYPDSSTFADAALILDRYGLGGRMPERIAQGRKGNLPDTPKKDDPLFRTVTNTIVASNRIALEAAASRAEAQGLTPVVLTHEMSGEASEKAAWFARLSREAAPGTCLIAGGETTVNVTGRGKGGRNMEFALAFAMDINGDSTVSCLSAGTDGTDGPTDAAGAVVSGRTVRGAIEKGLDPAVFLQNNDSYSFFEKVGGLLKTGATGTNVMDMVIALRSR
jgi:glycerate-2-kinase